MKKIFTLLCLTTFIFTSCSNDDDFVDTDTIGQTIDLLGVDFRADGDFTINFSFIDNNIEVFDSDVISVFRQEDVLQNGDPVWEPLPTANFFFFNDTTGAVEGFLNYRYNFTLDDVDIILSFDVPDASLVGAEFTDNQVFRIVVVPSAFAQENKIDITNYKALVSALNLNTENIPTVTF